MEARIKALLGRLAEMKGHYQDELSRVREYDPTNRLAMGMLIGKIDLVDIFSSELLDVLTRSPKEE
jgi:hypothetical protein